MVLSALLLVSLLAVVSGLSNELIQPTRSSGQVVLLLDDNHRDLRVKREVDRNFYRRLNNLEHSFGNNPFARSFLKYFIRNRAQRREKRQTSYDYYNNPGTFQNDYTRYNQRKQAVRPSRRTTTTTAKPKNKKFRPGMIFF